MDWITGIQRAIDYIEAHLTEELDYDAIARESFSSRFHFQRVFSILCGYPLGDYIRNRRLTLAGAELAAGNEKVIDIAAKYGYDSPDSFCKAFHRFHGITPSQARAGGNLRSFSRLSVKISLEGGSTNQSTINYRVEEKPAMLLTGYGKYFTGSPNDKREQDHEFACKNRVYEYILQGMSHEYINKYQILKDFTPDGYNFYYAYQLPEWALEDFDRDLGDMAKNFEHIPIPAGLYLVCETERCQWPIELADKLREQAVTQWLPPSDYVLRDAPEVGVIHWISAESKEDLEEWDCNYCEVWLPIEKKDTFLR